MWLKPEKLLKRVGMEYILSVSLQSSTGVVNYDIILKQNQVPEK